MKHTCRTFFQRRVATLLCTLLPACVALAQPQVVGWGDNTSGQLNAPAGLSTVTAVAGGDQHTVALLANGTVQVWGSGANGQRNIPAMPRPAMAVAAAGNQSWVLLDNGTLVGWGDPTVASLQTPPVLNDVVAVQAGESYAMALSITGTVTTWGDAALSPPAGLTFVKAIAGGAHHALALRADGTVVAWGDNARGQCNVPAGLVNVIAIAAGARHSIALLANGTAVAWGDNANGQAETAGISQVKAIACGADHTLYLKADGTVAGRGNDEANQAFVPLALQGVVSIASGTRYSLALTGVSRSLAVWGNDVAGQGVPPAPGMQHVLAVSSGINHNIVLFDNGTVQCWGSNSLGQCNVPAGLSNVKAVEAKGNMCMVLKADGTVTAWGTLNDIPVTIPAGMANVVGLVGELNAAAALAADGTVTAWGNPTWIRMPPRLENVKHLAMTEGLTLALKADGSLESWGKSTQPIHQIPAGIPPARTTGAGVAVGMIIGGNGNPILWGEYTAAYPQNPPSDFRGVDGSGGADHFIIRGANGNWYTDGSNFYGQLDVAVEISQRMVQINCGEQHSACVYMIDLPAASNASPSFSGGPDITVEANSGPYVQSRWARHIYPGIGEAAQGVRMVVEPGYDASLFLVPPNVDASGTLTFTPATGMLGTTSIGVYAEDDLRAKSPIQRFTITIAPNTPPSFAPGANVVVAEDGGPYAQPWATNISPGPETSQSVSFHVTTPDAALFAVQPQINNTGMLAFTPAPNANGVATITVVADDGALDNNTSPPRQFTITIVPVNDPPSFTPGSLVEVDEDSGPYSAPWATDIVAGPPDETGQTVTFTILPGYDASLFSQPPHIDAQGVLTFTPAPDAFDLTSIGVVAKDDGSGDNLTRAYVFTITIRGVNDAPRLTVAPTITIPVNSPQQTLSLSDIVAGPANEDDQNLTFQASTPDGLLLGPVSASAIAGGQATVTFAPNTFEYGTGTIEIILTDDGGTARGGVDESRYSVTVVVEDVVQRLFIPTTFSPNDDNMNDEFRIRGAGILSLELAIFDMAGQRVFHTTDIEAATRLGWNGKKNGTALPGGTYAWVLKGTHIDGTPLSFNGKQYGQVLLLR